MVRIVTLSGDPRLREAQGLIDVAQGEAALERIKHALFTPHKTSVSSLGG